MNKIVAIIQARCGSTRFPNKIFSDIDGKPLIWHVTERLKYAKSIDDIVVVDAIIRKYYSVLPRIEIDLKYSNQLCNYHQYKSMIKRKDFNKNMKVSYFK